MKKCLDCYEDISGRHANSKRCEHHAEEKRKKPVSTLTPDQSAFVINNIGKISRIDMAKHLSVPRSNIGRFLAENGLTSDSHKIKNKIVKEVIDYYNKVGSRVKTQEKFPNLRVRSIIEHNKHKIFSERWAGKELVEIAKMSTIIGYDQQAKLLNRQTTKKALISLKQKRYGGGLYNVNGIAYRHIKNICNNSVPILEIQSGHHSWFCLWVSIDRHIITDNENIKTMVKTLARFQNWLHGGNAYKSINKIIEDLSNEQRN